MHPIYAYGTDAQKAKYLPMLGMSFPEATCAGLVVD